MTWIRLLLCLYPLALLSLPGFAQTIDWARKAGGTSVEEGRGIATDATGYSYVTGYFSGTATFSSISGSISRTSAGDDDIFIAKYTPAGRLVWVRQAGGTGFDRGTAIALDNAGNLVITGVIQGTVSFETTSSTVTSAGGNDIVVAKFDTAGTFIWARNAGSAIIGSGIDFNEQGNAIATDNQNNIYVTGQFLGNAVFSSTVSVQSNGGTDIFIAKYLPNGDPDWAIRAGDPTTTTQNNDRAFGITIDQANNITITGDFENTISFGNNSLTGFGGRDIFVASYTDTGVNQWAHRAGTGIDNSNDRGNAIASDANGNVYVTGFFQRTATFEGNSSSVSVTSSGSQDVFIARYNAFGNLLWVVKGGSTGINNGRGISADAAGNALVTGSFENSFTFSGTTAATATLSPASASTPDVFVVKYNSAGAVQEAVRAGGSTIDIGYAISTDQQGRAYFTGYFTGSSAAFGTTTLASSGLEDIFVARFVPSVLLLPVDLISFKASAFTDRVVLYWQTASEKHNDYFVVERSADGRRFYPLQKISGAGSTSEIKSYTATDLQPISGTSYYRLRQTDFDGTTAYSPLVAVTFKPGAELNQPDLTVFPNPTTGQVSVFFNAPGVTKAKLQITNAMGQVIFDRVLAKQAGAYCSQFNLSGFAPGLYLVQIHSGTETVTRKLMLH